MRYVDWLRETEGLVPHFYKDTEAHVTIGVGSLVDDEATVRRRIRQWPQLFGDMIRVAGSPGSGPVTEEEIVDDWRRVRRARHKVGLDYANDALLRLGPLGTSVASTLPADEMLAKLYQRRHGAIFLHPYVVAALVDVLFNPAGYRLFGAEALHRIWHPLDAARRALEVGACAWEALNLEPSWSSCRVRPFDRDALGTVSGAQIVALEHLTLALDGFSRIAIGRASDQPRWHGRHAERTRWFHAGVESFRDAAASGRAGRTFGMASGRSSAGLTIP